MNLETNNDQDDIPHENRASFGKDMHVYVYKCLSL